MKQFTLTIDEKLNNKTVGQLLNHLKISKSLIIELKKGDFIHINGKHVTVRAIAKTGDVFTVTIPETQKSDVIPACGNLDILYEDDDILVVNKGANMPTHPTRRHVLDTLANIVCAYMGDGFVFRCVTRLDRDTTGVVLIAKNRYAAERLNSQIRNNLIKKEYYGVCVGEISEGGEINTFIKRETPTLMKRIVADDGQWAQTIYSPVCTHPKGTLVKLIPITGRTHQLRVHMSHINHPLYGDDLYGTPIDGARVLLHCKSIEFEDFKTNKTIRIEAPLPKDFN